MPGPRQKSRFNEVLPALLRLDRDADRQKFLSKHRVLVNQEVIEQLAPLVVKKIRVDAWEALRLAESVVLIARKLRRKECIALALRAKANALHACGKNRAAVAHHDQAYQIYASRGSWKEAARTLSSSIQPLILLGKYDRAFAAAEQAREIFSRMGEDKRIANLENNIGNIFHRQDRFEEAVAHYERAYQALATYQEWEHAAIALSNMAMCLISLNDFRHALDCYQRARELCVRYDMPRLRDQADYNIAYLYYFRGEYSRAIEILRATQRACEVSGDAYHLALCYLDLSEIYLELNLSEEAQEIAGEGFLRFQKLGMGYEAAKTLANEAIACGQQGKTPQALELFAKAREMFTHENNVVWLWLLDLYQGLLLFHEGCYAEARKLCTGAAQFFDQTVLAGKAVLAHLLLARIALQAGDLTLARQEAETVITKLLRVQTPELRYQAHFLLGQIASRRGDQAAALARYQEARKALEALRTRLQSEELKISFVKNRLQVYEALVELHIDGQAAQISEDQCFGIMEAAKSRSMLEMIFQSGQSLFLSEATQSNDVQKIRDLREELNWYYHRMELEQLRPEGMSRERMERLQQLAQSRENELLRALRELPAQRRQSATLEVPPDFSVAELQAAIPADTALVEYYSAGDRLVAAVVTRKGLEIKVVADVPRVAHLLKLLRFQLSKFRMDSRYTQEFEEPLLRATLSHLEALYRELIKPLRPLLGAQHLVFVPHGALHFLPFHALRNGDEYMGEAYTVSYAPSAAVYAVCQQKEAGRKRSSLVLGVPDERAPQISHEVQAVAALLPQAELYLGKEAAAEVLREKGPEAGLLHIATHGIYRQDNPMFSSIRLGDGYLNLYDLYELRMGAKLVTLSGCATGMNFVAAGDELLGLQRGLFYAGATSLLLSLWDVHDSSTAEFMQEFYRGYIRSGDMAASLQAAMRELRREHPHPYFWAPFVLVGKGTEKPARRPAQGEVKELVPVHSPETISAAAG
ncbi:MAG TPA: CHAT domain-containing tetratricopeptide repeat protein [Terriglobales bacterium]|nr:CHAT domain-containing tetratricopeptide repeat protein [Terriglobales bacterium]